MNKIQIRSLKKSFGDNIILNSIDLDIRDNSSLVILGGSGTGKSVLIKTIIGLLRPDAGIILFDGKDITSPSGKEHKKFLNNCGFLFQGGALFDSLTVSENITFLAEKLCKLDKTQKKDLVMNKLEIVGLSDKVANLYPVELSGGMQKRVALARAIATNPKIIFFDEPTTGLDPIMSNVINDLIMKIRKDLNATIITITHDINSASSIATDLALIDKGCIIWTGCISEIADRQKIKNPYLKQFILGSYTGPLNIKI